MASQKSLEALEKIRASLKDIQDNHIGRLLSHLDESQHPRVQAQAKAALALTMGTLRLMGSRLRGMDNVDPLLRTELNNMRKLLRGVQKRQDDTKKSGAVIKRQREKTTSKPQNASRENLSDGAQKEHGEKRHRKGEESQLA